MLGDMHTILCPTALGPRWEQVFHFAMKMARCFDAEVVVVHAVEPLSPTAKVWVDQMIAEGTVDAIRTEGIAKLRQELRQRVERVCREELTSDPEALKRVSEIRIEESFPAELILNEAERVSADVIVMGSHEHSVLGEILGSVAHKVIHRSSVPVVLFPLKGSEE